MILAQLAITFSVICIDSFSQSKIARITNAFYLPLFLVKIKIDYSPNSCKKLV
ncbi:hypothetical protein HMPREF1402_00087 [Helicobacter pylori GAM121Aii]|nr:hypothetical protein HMPREF1402_00087 [Helicobacter pylori GAM121Aii]